MADKKKAVVESAAPASDKKKALETAMAQIEKAYGKGSIMRLGDNADIVVEAIPTGSLSLDLALGIGGFPRPVYHTPHDRHFHRLVHCSEALFHFLREPNEVHLAAPAGGTADELGGATAQVQGAEQRPAGPHFHHGVVRERDAHGVADALFQKDAQAACAFDDALEGGSRLGDADVQRHLGQLGGQQAIGVDGGLHVVGLG
mgnify:CR=1 FL=1